MRKLIKLLKILTFLSSGILLNVTLISCGGGGGGIQSGGEQRVQALVNSSWAVDVTNTNVSNVMGSLDKTTFTVEFTSNTDLNEVSITFGGDLSNHISGGSFDVAENGSISNATLTGNSTLSIGTPTVSMNSANTMITIQVTVNSARSTGVGTYTLVFTS